MAGGDGNLTQQTDYASATDTRVTGFGYDWRDRRTSRTDALNGYEAYTLDNLDRMTQTQQYDSPTGTLIGQTQTSFDDRGRVYKRINYSVSGGVTGLALTENSWYDYAGNLLQRISEGDGKVFTKQTYNGVGWVTGSYRGYNTSGTSWTQANGVSSTDTIVEQNIPTYDEVGNVVSAASFQRLNDATGTGALSASTQPEARISYAANWFDGIDRLIASANYGAISSFTRPSTPPASSATVLVDLTGYDVAGRVSSTTDPAGIVTQNSFDNASRTTQVVEAYGSTTPRTTQWTYTLDDLVATMTAVNGTTNQTTTWTYGTGSSSGVYRNDLLASVTYPDSIGGSDVVSYTYNRLGQQLTTTDQRGTTRTFYYDKLGRLTDDAVSTVGSNTDGAVRRINRGYEVRGMVSALTSYDNPTPGSGTVLNQCALTYNGFRQLTDEQQEHSGSVTGSSLNVQYGYFPGTGNLNYIRPTSLTYPNGRVINLAYTGMDSQLSRITSISDSSATLASYLYLGIGTVIRIQYPQPSIWLDLWGGTSSVFNGFDQFGRIIDQRWQDNTGTTPTDIDRYQYGYDQASNRLWKANVVGTPHVTAGLDEFYVYDPLNRLTTMQRGILNSGRTGLTGTPAREVDYTLDAVGNWTNYLTKTSGTTDLTQTRTNNTVNEITAISGTPTWATPAYDQAGNMTTMPQPATPGSSFTAVYDAWNRMVKLSAGGTTKATYAYDGRNRRIVKVTPGIPETRHFYFTDNWQDIEERTGSPAAMERQYVWGIRYIDELICRDRTSERFYVAQDANFNVTSIHDTTGTPQERYYFDPYGTPTFMDGSWNVLAGGSAKTWTVLHQSLLTDYESNLSLNRNRSIHPSLGVFVQRDRPTSTNDANEYEYERSSPGEHRDPLGRCVDNCPAIVVPIGPLEVSEDKAAKEMMDQLQDQLKDVVKDWVEDVVPSLKPLDAIFKLGAKGIDRSLEDVYFVGIVIPCKCGSVAKDLPRLYQFMARPNGGPADGGGGKYNHGAGVDPESWNRAMQAAKRLWHQSFNSWIDQQFPKCKTIQQYHVS